MSRNDKGGEDPRPEDDDASPRLSPAERIRRARKWARSHWTDEAVLIYRRSAHGRDRLRVLTVESFLFVREVIREFYRVQGSARAASLAYTTLLSLIPLLVAFTQILRSYFSKLFPDFRAQVDVFLNVIVPYRSAEIATHLNRFAENAEAASTFGAIVFLIVSFRLFMAVESTINLIWKVPSARAYKQKLRAYTMLLFWGPLLIGLSFTTSASLDQNPYLRYLVENEFILRLVPVFVLFVAFTMLFWLVPSTSVRFKSAAIGGLITTALFQLVRYGFGIYAQHLFTGRLNVIYGTLGLFVIFLLALEIMWVVVLLGVEISYVHQNLHGILRASEQQLANDPAYDTYFALRALIEISRRYENREEAPSHYRLAEELGATDAQMLIILRKLEDAELVKEIGGDWTGFVPGGDADRITVQEVVANIEGGRRDIPDGDHDAAAREAVAALFESLRASADEAIGTLTIGRIVRQLYGAQHPSRVTDFPASGQ